MYRNKNLFDKLPFAPIAGAFFGLATAILVMATPAWLFARAVVGSGLPSILSAAQPPLGVTARLLAAIVLGVLVAAIMGAIIHFAERFSKRARPEKPPKAPKARGERIEPIIAAPARRKPIFAEAELGAPFMSDEAMEVAKNELILDIPMTEEALEQKSQPILDAPSVDQIDDAKPADAPSLAPAFVSLVQEAPPARLARPTEFDSISGLMGRLENALALRQSLNTPGNPIPAGDIASLRRALGAAR
jgi:hypothetical protein